MKSRLLLPTLALILVLSLPAACQPLGFLRRPTPTPAGPFLTLFIEPQAGEAPVLEAINNAQTSVRLKAYLLTHPRVIEALKAAARRGVSVRVILELKPYGGGVDPGIITDLLDSGVELKGSSRVFNYTHEKSMVIDDAMAFIMTGNMTASSFSNREYGIITRHPQDVAEVTAVFEADWAREGIDLSESRLIWAPDNARQRMLAFIDEAQSTLDIEQQNMQDPEVIAHIEAALRRGLRVRIISSPGYPIEKDMDEPGRDRLRRAGAQVRYLSTPYIHAKVFVIDSRRGFVGSQNLTTNSLDFNRELGILFDEAEPVAQLAAQFEADWAVATDRPFPAAEVTPEGGVISHKDARQHLHQELTVELTVTHTYNSGRVIWLMPDDDRDNNFKVVIFPSAWNKFPEVPDMLYKGKTIRVRGLIEEYRGWPEIVVERPEQIEVVE
ncbi:MAG: phospholipase D-like domain-containing protein [Anaerolineae bacterium]|nr:phospholipase D-like domain-containing protein [Anaerolineae bacterium]